MFTKDSQMSEIQKKIFLKYKLDGYNVTTGKTTTF